jgi:uncharacterized protein (TIGR03066 family)
MNPRQTKERHARSSKAPASEKPFAWLWRWVAIALILTATAGGSWALLEYVVWAKLSYPLVGKWVVEGGEQDGATFDFYRNGRMLGRVNVGGREGIIEARVRVEDNKLLTTTRNPMTGQDETRPQTIQLLTDESLVLVDEDKMILRMVRAK